MRLLDSDLDGRFRDDVASLTAKKGAARRNPQRRPRPTQPSTSPAEARAGRAHRTRTPPGAHQAHRNAASEAHAATDRRAPHRRPRPTGAAQHRPGARRSRRRTGHRAPGPTNRPRTAERAAKTPTRNRRRRPGCPRRRRPGRSERATRHGREQEPARDRHRDAARDERRARTRRQPLPQRGRERTAREPDRGRASRHHGLNHGESREAPEARARRIPSAEDRDPRSSATHRQRLQRQRIPARSAADGERGTRGSREHAPDHAADERAEARRQLPGTTETDRRKHKTPPKRKKRHRPKPRRPTKTHRRRASPSRWRAQAERVSRHAPPCRGRSQGRPERSPVASGDLTRGGRPGLRLCGKMRRAAEGGVWGAITAPQIQRRGGCGAERRLSGAPQVLCGADTPAQLREDPRRSWKISVGGGAQRGAERDPNAKSFPKREERGGGSIGNACDI